MLLYNNELHFEITALRGCQYVAFWEGRFKAPTVNTKAKTHKYRHYQTTSVFTRAEVKSPLSKFSLLKSIILLRPTLKELTFLSSPIASNHSTFPATEILVSEVPAVLWKFGWKGVTSEAASLKLSWQPGHVYVMSFRPTQNWQERENLQLTWHQSQGQQNLFFPSDYHFTILNVFSLEFGAHLPRIIWLKSSYNPECLSDRMMSQEHGLAAEYR